VFQDKKYNSSAQPVNESGNAPASAPENIAGARLAWEARHRGAATRALNALNIYGGVEVVISPTRKQACQLAGSSVNSMSLVANATPAQRAELERGLITLTDLRRARKSKTSNPEDIRAFVERHGIEAVFAVVDEMTAPPAASAAE
jgi:hypothetical protein